MFERLINWFRKSPEPYESRPADPLRRTGGHALPQSAKSTPAVPRRQPEFVEPDPDVSNERDSDSRAQKRSKYVREDTGTHETLKIIDDSLDGPDDEDDVDPYNAGAFDRSRNWDKRSR